MGQIRMSARAFFRYPSPVDETSARLVAAGVVATGTAALALGQPWLTAPLAYGFLARAAAGPRLSPLAQVVNRVVRPRLDVPFEPAPGPAKRFAAACGATLATTAAVSAFTGGQDSRTYRVALGSLLAAASAEAFGGYCIACRSFALLIRTGIVPEETCAECANIWARTAPTGAAS